MKDVNENDFLDMVNNNKDILYDLINGHRLEEIVIALTRGYAGQKFPKPFTIIKSLANHEDPSLICLGFLENYLND